MNGADEIAIPEVIARYGRGLDARNAPLLLSCFAEDARIEYFGGAHVVEGIDAIAAFFDFSRGGGLPGVDSIVMTTHVWVPMSVDVDGDRANASTNCVAYLLGAVGDEHVLINRGLHYEDELRRDGDSWLITRRRHLPDWETRGPAMRP